MFDANEEAVEDFPRTQTFSISTPPPPRVIALFPAQHPKNILQPQQCPPVEHLASVILDHLGQKYHFDWDPSI